MRRLKDILFLGEVNNFKCIMVHKGKGVSDLEGGKGAVRASFPRIPAGRREEQWPVWGELPHGDSP